jgi:hypothetical protein
MQQASALQEMSYLRRTRPVRLRWVTKANDTPVDQCMAMLQ